MSSSPTPSAALSTPSTALSTPNTESSMRVSLGEELREARRALRTHADFTLRRAEIKVKAQENEIRRLRAELAPKRVADERLLCENRQLKNKVAGVTMVLEEFDGGQQSVAGQAAATSAPSNTDADPFMEFVTGIKSKMATQESQICALQGVIKAVQEKIACSSDSPSEEVMLLNSRLDELGRQEERLRRLIASEIERREQAENNVKAQAAELRQVKDSLVNALREQELNSSRHRSQKRPHPGIGARSDDPNYSELFSNIQRRCVWSSSSTSEEDEDALVRIKQEDANNGRTSKRSYRARGRLVHQNTESDTELDKVEEETKQLLIQIEASAPWESMFDKCPGFSHTFEYRRLDATSKRLVDKFWAYNFDHRRALWERKHWVEVKMSWSEVQRYRNRRMRRSSNARLAWDELVKELRELLDKEQTSDHSHLTIDVLKEPFMWEYVRTLCKVPEWCKTMEDLKKLDQEEPSRIFHIRDIQKHDFYNSLLSRYHPTRDNLPVSATGRKSRHDCDR